ncbi:MAG: hypothetical protein UDB11_06695 [Peptococcaceae bacterium]|nr:hypothetical protein [Peptococcaceae bacterium]
MSVRKGYLYALMLALGLFLWTNVADAWSEPAVPEAKQADTTVVQPWTSAEALYESSMKAQELRLKLVAMHTASDTQQGSLELLGAQEDLQTFYTWLENEGRFQRILSLRMETVDTAVHRLSVHFQL